MVGLESQQSNLCKILLLLYVFCSCNFVNQVCPAVKTGYYHARGNPPGTEIQKTISTNSESKMMHIDINEIEKNRNGMINLQPHDKLNIKHQEINKLEELISNSNKSNHNNFTLEKINTKSEKENNVNQLSSKYKMSNQQRKKRCVKKKLLSSKKSSNESSSKLENTRPPCCDSLNKLLSETMKLQSTCKCLQSFELTKLSNRLQHTEKSNENNIVKLRDNNNDAYEINNLESNANELEMMKKDEQDLNHINQNSKPEYYMNHINLDHKYNGIKPNNQYITERKNYFNKLGDQIEDIITESSINKENLQTKRDFSYETTENEYKANNEINVIKENNPNVENYSDLTDYKNTNEETSLVNDKDNMENLKDNEEPHTLNNNINYPMSKQQKNMYSHKVKNNDISSNGNFYPLQFNENNSPLFKMINDRIDSFVSDYDNKQRMEDTSNDYSIIDGINMIQENDSKKENYVNSEEDKSVVNEDNNKETMKEYNNKAWDLNKNGNYPVVSEQNEEIHSIDTEYNDNYFSKDHSNIFNDYENNSPFSKISDENTANTFDSNYNNANNNEQKMDDDTVQNNNYPIKEKSLLPLKDNGFPNIKKLTLERKKQVVEETTLNANLENNINLIYHDLNKEKTSFIKQTISKDNNEMQSKQYDVMQPNETDKSTNIESIDVNNSDDSRGKIEEKININTKQNKLVNTEDSNGRLSQDKDAEVLKNYEYVTEDDEIPVILDSENYSQEKKLYNNDKYEENLKTNNELHENIQDNKLINQNNSVNNYNTDKSKEKYDETIEKYNDNIFYEERQLDEQTEKGSQNHLPEENKTQTNEDKFNNYNDTDYSYSQLDDKQLSKVNDNDKYDWNESNNYNYSTNNDNNEHELNIIKENDPNKIISEINDVALSTDINSFGFMTTNKNENIHNIKSVEYRNNRLNNKFFDDNASFTEKIKSKPSTLKDTTEKNTNIIQEHITTKSFKNNHKNDIYFNKDVTSDYGITSSTDENNLKNTDESMNESNESNNINTEKANNQNSEDYENKSNSHVDKYVNIENERFFTSNSFDDHDFNDDNIHHDKDDTLHQNIKSKKIIKILIDSPISYTPTIGTESSNIQSDNSFKTQGIFDETEKSIRYNTDFDKQTTVSYNKESVTEKRLLDNATSINLINISSANNPSLNRDIFIQKEEAGNELTTKVPSSLADIYISETKTIADKQLQDEEELPESKTSTSKQLGNNNYITFTDEPSLEFTKTYDKITIVPQDNSKVNFNIKNKKKLPDYIEENKSLHDDFVTDENAGTLSQFISNELISTNNPVKETSSNLITETNKKTDNLIFSNSSPDEYPITNYKDLNKINANDSYTDEINKENTIMTSSSSNNVHENLLKPDDTTFYDNKELKKNIYENVDHTSDQFINTDITAAIIHDDTTYDTSTTLNDFRKITTPNEITNTENKYLENSDFTDQTYVAISKESEKISNEHQSKTSENYNDEDKYNNYENNSKNKLNLDVTKYESKSVSELTPIVTEIYNDRVFLSEYTDKPEIDDNYSEPSEYIKDKHYTDTTMKIFLSNDFKENETDDSKISKNIIVDNIGVTMRDDMYKSLHDDEKIIANSKIENIEDKYSENPDFIDNKHLVERNKSEIISNKFLNKEDYNNDYDNSNNNENITNNKSNPFASKDESKSTSESAFIVSNVLIDQNKIENTEQPEIYGDIYIESNKYTTDKNKHYSDISIEQPSLNNNKIIDDKIDNKNNEIENTAAIKHDDASKTTNYFTEQTYGAGSYDSETPLNKYQNKLSESNQISFSNDKKDTDIIVHSDVAREETKFTSSSPPFTNYLSSNKKMVLTKNNMQSDNTVYNYNDLNLYATEKYNTDFTDVTMQTTSPNRNKNIENEIISSKIDNTIKTDQGKKIEQNDIDYDTSKNLNDYRKITSNEIVNIENKYTEIPNFIDHTDRGKSKELEDILNENQSKPSKSSNYNNLNTDKYTSYKDDFEKEIEINNFIENVKTMSATPLPIKLISSTHLNQKLQEIESTSESTETLPSDNPIKIPFSEKSLNNIFNNAEQKKSSNINENLQQNEFSTIHDNYQTTNISENDIQNNIISNSIANDEYISKHVEKNYEKTSEYPEDLHSNYIVKNEIEKLTTTKEFDKKKINELNFINNYDENIKELLDDNNKINFKMNNNYPSQTTTKENLDLLNEEINNIYTTLTPEHNELDFNREVIDENINADNSPLTVTEHKDQAFKKPATEMSSDYEKKLLDKNNIQNTTIDDINTVTELNSDINSENKQNIFISSPSFETEKDNLRINKLPTTLPINYENNVNFNNNIDDNYVASKLNKSDSISDDSIVPLYKQEKHFFKENYDKEDNGIQLSEETDDNQLNSNELMNIPKEGFPAVISVPVWITINDSSLVSSSGSKFYVENNGEKTELTVKKTAKPLMLSISPHYLLTNNLNDDRNNRGRVIPVKSSTHKRTNKNNMKIDFLEPPTNSKDDFLDESRKKSSNDDKSIYFFIIPVEKDSNLYEIENSTLVPISLNNKQLNSLNKDELLNENNKYDKHDSTNKIIENENLIDLSDRSINTIKPTTQSNINLKYKKEDLMSKYPVKTDKDVNDEFLNVYHKNNNEENTNADSLPPKDATYSQMKRSLYDNMLQWFHDEKLKRIKNEKIIDPNMNVIEAVYTSVKKLKDIFQN